jgi:hypothetical protein
VLVVKVYILLEIERESLAYMEKNWNNFIIRLMIKYNVWRIGETHSGLKKREARVILKWILQKHGQNV